MTAIYKRELKSYFHSMIGYLIIAVMTAFTSIYFMAYNLYSGYPYFSYVLSSTAYILIIIIPLLTMRCFSEERKNKTDQLLLCAPVKLSEVVIGKYLAMVTVIAIPCLAYCVFPLIIKSFGTAYFKVDYVAIGMFFLLGCIYIAIGTFLSTLTESTIIAAVITFGALMLTFLWDGLTHYLPSSQSGNMIGCVLILTALAAILYSLTHNWALAGGVEIVGVAAIVVLSFVKGEVFESLLPNFFEKLSVVAVFDQIVTDKTFSFSGLVLYASFIGVFLFLTMQSIQKRRWS